MQYDIETLVKFAEATTKKLREMEISQAFNPGGSRPKSLFRELLQHLDWLKELKADIASADTLPTRDYMRTAAKRAAQQTYQVAEHSAVSSVIEILKHCYWEMADVVAKALVYEMTTTEKAKKAIKRGDNSEASDFSLRFFLHATLASDTSPTEFFHHVTNNWVFQDFAILEDFGWLQGAIDALGMGDGSPDGVFLILRVKDVQVITSLKAWLAESGAVRISTPQMWDVLLNEKSNEAK